MIKHSNQSNPSKNRSSKNIWQKDVLKELKNWIYYIYILFVLNCIINSSKFNNISLNKSLNNIIIFSTNLFRHNSILYFKNNKKKIEYWWTFFLGYFALDHTGRVKPRCWVGNGNSKGSKPICGPGCDAILLYRESKETNNELIYKNKILLICIYLNDNNSKWNRIKLDILITHDIETVISNYRWRLKK
jgi:hypothetical protein